MKYRRRLLYIGLLTVISFTGVLLFYKQEPETLLDQKLFSQIVVNQNINLVFYKNDCPYCKAAEKDVFSSSKKNSFPTFFIDLDTEEGQILKMKYGVKYASTIVSIRTGSVELFLYAKKEDGKFVPDKLKIEQAFVEAQGE